MHKHYVRTKVKKKTLVVVVCAGRKSQDIPQSEFRYKQNTKYISKIRQVNDINAVFGKIIKHKKTCYMRKI